jgi:small-conductance mechanosensitive channel
MIKNMTIVIRLVIWAAAVLFILDNLGINITAAVAGLSVGGVAVALAAQAVLGDAFSSFAIFMDKPFQVGDFIIVGDLLGAVEHVGFKTTRIEASAAMGEVRLALRPYGREFKGISGGRPFSAFKIFLAFAPAVFEPPWPSASASMSLRFRPHVL